MDVCGQIDETFIGCTAADVAVSGASSTYVASVSIPASSATSTTIRATAISGNGLNGETYDIIGTFTANGAVEWEASGGTCTAAGIC